MPPSITNLRRGVVTGGVALLVVLAVFLGIARLKGHHFHLDLPGRLGVEVSQTANGFTWSQSQKGHTLFTIHASKLVQYKNDQAELHDVTITLYGPEGSGRTDKIYGAEFKYDRKQGIARATGPVQIDFASPEAKAGATVKPAPPPDNTIHVTTSGVVFNQATGEASTGQRVDFVLPRATGSATGAEYNAKSGVLVLDSQVALVTSTPGSQPAMGLGDTTIHAEHAQLLRETHQAYLIKDDATSQGKHTTSDQATITFRPDGSAQHIDAEGHVHVTTDDGADVHASTAAIDLDTLSHPLLANLSGGVTYHATEGDRTMQGTAVSGTLAFAAPPAPGPVKPKAPAQQQLKHAQFRDAVTFVLQQHSLNGDPNGSATREMSASKLDIEFAPGPAGKSEAQHVLGAGGATATLHDVPSKGSSKSTSISGDQLLATLADGRVFKVLDGKGHTKIVDTSSDGATSTSTGDTLHVTFIDPAAAKAAVPASSTAQVDTAVQTGNVTLLQIPAAAAAKKAGATSPGPGQSGPPSPLHATAQRAEYQAADQVLHLTGDPHLRNDIFALSADKVDYHRDTGDAAAIGNVKSTYAQQPGEKAPTLGGDGPVHVTADHAQLTGSSDISVFYGTATQPARLWQGGDAVAAPVLELSRDDQTLDAHGARGDHAAVVHTTLGAKAAGSQVGAAKPPAAASRPGASTTSSGPVRLTSTTLHYADQDRRADLRGSVTAEQPSGTVHADQAQIYLTPATPNTPGAKAPAQLDHLVATGHVLITQPGRRGTGDKLVYTAADGRYVLTGTPAQPPRITDAQKGTTTGAALLFKTADDSVEVSSHADPVPGSSAPPDPHAHTVTDTHTPN